MKHPPNVALWITLLFLTSQLVGLAILNQYSLIQDGQMVYRDVPSFLGIPLERPDVSPAVISSFMWFGLLIGTLIVFLLLRQGWFLVWKFWYAIAVILCLHIALASTLPPLFSTILALAFGAWKLFRPGVIIHNATEILIHSGLAALFVPLLTIKSMLAVYALVAVYDAYAVWKSKHMVALAKFQAKSGMFAGFVMPYHVPHKKIMKKIEGKKVQLHAFRTAILGGGDVAFPLLFAGVVQHTLGAWQAAIVSLSTAISLYLLLYFGRKNQFYPAIPFLLAGSLAGLALSLLL
ncbi:hypothetical protein HY490_01150 [Candidatus Woesearchaeota archaeon]|nr:hypothetical protein [Candidatus Woesearchaeota archaeon]